MEFVDELNNILKTNRVKVRFIFKMNNTEERYTYENSHEIISSISDDVAEIYDIAGFVDHRSDAVDEYLEDMYPDFTLPWDDNIDDQYPAAYVMFNTNHSLYMDYAENFASNTISTLIGTLLDEGEVKLETETYKVEYILVTK